MRRSDVVSLTFSNYYLTESSLIVGIDSQRSLVVEGAGERERQEGEEE